MVEVFDLHQAEHKTIHYPHLIRDLEGILERQSFSGVISRTGSRKNRRFLWVYDAGWSSGSSSGS